MTCSRCGHTVPNIECYVCHDPDWKAEPDCFSRAKDAAIRDDKMSFQFIKDGSDCSDAFIEQQ
jgi:hypothetical protein